MRFLADLDIVRTRTMDRRKWTMLLFGAACFAKALAPATAQVTGIGSCGLDDVMDTFSKEQRLLDEIRLQMKIQKVEMDDTNCEAALIYLADRSHGRVGPYEITIGSKTLHIYSKIVLLSKSGKRLPDDAFDRAYDYREENVTWSWE
jgi:hypothetical protein